MREEFSPFACTSHMVDDFSTELFVFLGGVGFVEDAVFTMLERNTPKTLYT